jgi:hypothetical protein
MGGVEDRDQALFEAVNESSPEKVTARDVIKRMNTIPQTKKELQNYGIPNECLM